MKYSFTTMATPGMPIGECLALAQRNGFQGIDLRCHHEQGEVRPDSGPEQLDETAALFKARNIRIPSILCYNNWPDRANANWDAAAAELRKMLLAAERLKAEAIRLFPRVPRNLVELDSYVDDTVRFFQRVLKESVSDVAIYLQNHKGSLDARQTASLCRRVGNERLGMVFSPDHTILMGESQDGLLAETAFCVKEIFIADLDAERKTVLPGAGVVPLNEIIRFFRERGFEGFFSFKWEKIWNPELAPAAEVLPAFVRFMERL